MYVVRIMPIARGAFKDQLSFFSREALPEGVLVSAPLRGKATPGIVLTCEDAREEKLDLKNAGFALKKLGSAKPKKAFTDAFIAAARDTALFHAATDGAAFAALTMSAVLESATKLAEASSVPTSREDITPRADLLVLQAETEERVRTYRNLAREAFARGSSVLLIAPTIIEAERLKSELERGIEEHVILFTSDIPKKKLLEAWNRAAEDPAPLLAIGTGAALSLPRRTWDSIIVERESAASYRGRARPHLDLRRAAEYLARRLGCRFILADFPVRIETRYRVEAHEMDDLARPQARASGTAEIMIIDTRTKDGERGTGAAKRRTFRTLSEKSLEQIRTEVAKGGRAVVFAARRGLAPLTVCNDCGTPVTDPSTGVPMVLHKTPEGNVFVSHRSGAMLSSGISCRTCGSWNLVTLGIGVDRVFDELKKSLPETPLILFTAETAPTHRAAKKLAESFYDSPGTVIVGTERMLPYLGEPVEAVAVASLDSLLSLSVWRAEERAASILFYLRAKAETACIVETRKPDSVVMKTFLSGNPADLYRADIAERERYFYPPFATFIGLAWRGALPAVEKHSALVTESFADTDLVGPLPPVAEGKGLWSARAVMRLERAQWPDEALAARIKALPPSIEVVIDPDEIV